MNDIADIVNKLKQSRRLLFVTGAGMSVDSGIPTYRGIGGLYNNNELIEGMTIEEIMSGHVMRTNPELVWKCLASNSSFFKDASPNRGHEIIAEMEKNFEICVYTQNVDGFHSLAGSTNVIDVHGNTRVLCCMNCDQRDSLNNITQLKIPPLCTKCGKIMRPNVVLFGEMLCPTKMTALSKEMLKGFDMVIIIGTSGRFPYIVSPVFQLYKHGSFVIEINPETTEISDLANIHLVSGASQSLETIWSMYLKQ
ncbi:NAD-dependent deacetylase [Candidatus Uabimicrobium sp. HlEnr_7]|uniref:SIR2 family NAD-dependent protein deacylase n=1 Tax=Candidatus Uabimicrobium helgolandensis TaxID=3095367 RepID=UPI0035579C0A